jgi:hypothetical protein
LGKYEAERNGRLGHKEAQVLCGDWLVAGKKALFACIINPRCASFEP